MLKQAKVENFNWHDLRDTFASRLVIRGVNLYTFRERIGHVVISVTIRCMHVAP